MLFHPIWTALNWNAETPLIISFNGFASRIQRLLAKSKIEWPRIDDTEQGVVIVKWSICAEIERRITLPMSATLFSTHSREACQVFLTNDIPHVPKIMGSSVELQSASSCIIVALHRISALKRHSFEVLIGW